MQSGRTGEVVERDRRAQDETSRVLRRGQFDI